MKHLLNTINAKRADQRTRARPDQVQNNAGGYVFRVSDEQRLLRFLILGTEGGTFYATARGQTKLETGFVQAYAAKSGLKMVQTILDVARNTRAPKADPSLLALAAVAKLGDVEARKAAWDALPEVARTGTMLLHFLAFVQSFGGWGRLTRRGVANVYETLPLDKLALWSIKYKGRDGWTQADALRLAHPKTEDTARNAVFKFMVDGVLDGATETALRVIEGHLLALKAGTDAEAANLMHGYGLPIEAVPTHVRGPEVYRAAMQTNGLTWLLRNLGNLGRVGLLLPGAWDVTQSVVARLTDEGALRKGRIHPLDVLKALMVYRAGRGVRGSGEWAVVPQVVDALEAAFDLSFGTVKPTGKRFLLGVDVSGSMTGGMVAGVPGLTPNVAASAMAMVTFRRERQALAMGFAHDFRDLNITPRDTLDTVARKTQISSFGGTDCALPMTWALKNKVQTDMFVVYTDSETWAGKIHPHAALEQYRQRMGTPARLIVVGLTSTGFTIADPLDAGMLDVVGFDSAAPAVMSAFARGEV